LPVRSGFGHLLDPSNRLLVRSGFGHLLDPSNRLSLFNVLPLPFSRMMVGMTYYVGRTLRRVCSLFVALGTLFIMFGTKLSGGN
jgi:hypothetical protein